MEDTGAQSCSARGGESEAAAGGMRRGGGAALPGVRRYHLGEGLLCMKKGVPLWGTECSGEVSFQFWRD